MTIIDVVPETTPNWRELYRIRNPLDLLSDANVIFDLRNARRGPGGVHGFGVLGAGAHGAAEADDAVRGVGLDMGGIDEGASFNGFIDGDTDVGWMRRGFEPNLVLDALDAGERGERPFRLFLLIVPGGGTG